MTVQLKHITAALAGAGILVSALPSFANDNSELESLRELVQQLDQKVKILERKNEIADEDNAAAKKTTPIVSASEKGFSIKSADGAHEIRLRGSIQTDARIFPSGDAYASGNTNAAGVKASDTYLLKQFRPILQGTLWNKYDFLLTPDFGGGKTTIQDAYVDAKFTPYLQVKVGKQKTPFGIERLQGDADGKFTERGLPNNLVPNRDIGLQIHGTLAEGKLEYAGGYFNGVVDGNSSDSYTSGDTDNNRDKDFVGRLFATPFKDDIGFLQGLGFGIAATYADLSGSGTGVSATTAQSISESNLPGFRSALGQQSFFKYRTASAGAANGTYADGQRLRWSPQFYYYNGPFGVLGEYVQVDQDVSRVPTGGAKSSDKLSNDAWQIVASWILTGEDASYANPTPKQPFDIEKGTGWGAWELVARYSELNIDDKAFAGLGSGTAAAKQARSYADPTASAKQASAWALGVNWYLNKNLKWALGYEQTSFDGGWTTGASGIVLDRPTEKVVSSRLQVTF